MTDERCFASTKKGAGTKNARIVLSSHFPDTCCQELAAIIAIAITEFTH